MQHFDPHRGDMLPLDSRPEAFGVRRRPAIGRLIDVVLIGCLALLLLDGLGIGG